MTRAGPIGTSLPASLQLGEERNGWCSKVVKLVLELNPQTQEEVAEPALCYFPFCKNTQVYAGSSSCFSHLIK